MKILILIITSVMLSACAASTNSKSSSRTTCEGFGYRVGTSDYDNCIYMQQSINDNNSTKIIKEYTTTGAEF